MIYAIDLNPSLDRTLRYERLMLGQVNRAASVRTDLSGKGVNVATTLRGLECETAIMGLAGGATGRVLVESLRAAGYDCTFAPVAGETRSNITVLDDATGITTKLNERGPTVSADDLAAFEALLLSQVRRGDWCALAGSLPPSAPVDYYARLIERLHELGAQVALDSSGPALAFGCTAGPELIKPNEIEAQQLLGLDEPPNNWSAPLAALLALGPKQVLLTLGATGAWWASAQGAWWATAPAIDERSNVGAGDAALAGALYGLTQDRPPADCLRWAVAAGSAKAARDGTAMPTRAQVAVRYEQIVVTQVAKVAVAYCRGPNRASMARQHQTIER